MLLAIERSTELHSMALEKTRGGEIFGLGLGDGGVRDGNWTVALERAVKKYGAELRDVKEILVGTGPGSFAGIRATLAFAHGISLATGAKVIGIPSTAGLMRSYKKRAVVGDARRGRFWVVKCDGYRQVGDFRVVGRDELKEAVEWYDVISPDAHRIGDTLKEVLGNRYQGSLLPLAEFVLRAHRMSCGHLVQPEPTPVYLNPAVRAD